MSVHELSGAHARRIAVRAQLLGRERPAGLIGMVRHLTLLQADRTAAVAPSADLVAWSRLGSSYSRADLASALADRTLVELRGLIRPAGDMALYTAEMAAWPGCGPLPDWREDTLRWVDANDQCRLDILDRLGSDGPLTMRELPDTCAVPWRSTGWTNNRNVSVLINFLVRRGEVAMAGWRGRDRLWDLAERVYPDDPMVPVDQAFRIRAERRLAALGIARARAPECPDEPSDVGEVGEPAVVEGVRGEWRVDPAQLGQPFTGRAALLSPLDRLVYDRKRMSELFGFDYQLEMYKPAARRRWGYWALPILSGDRLIGKLDAAADRASGMLRVNAIHQDEPFGRATAAAVHREIRALADWLGLDLRLPAMR
ncbi:MAG: DNA glycosylase AlkZ-like family protein [Streptosporangiaceae bacterium]